MILVYKNIKMLCDKNDISLETLLVDLSIQEEVYFLKRKSKKAKNEREEAFGKIATYFGVSLDELKNRDFELPYIYYELLDNELTIHFFENLYQNTVSNIVEWKMDDYDTGAHAQAHRYDVSYSFISFSYQCPDYSICLKNHTSYDIEIDCGKAEILKKYVNYNYDVELDLYITGGPTKHFFSKKPGVISKENDYVRMIYDYLLRFYGLEDYEKWHRNEKYQNRLRVSFSEFQNSCISHNSIIIHLLQEIKKTGHTTERELIGLFETLANDDILACLTTNELKAILEQIFYDANMYYDLHEDEDEVIVPLCSHRVDKWLQNHINNL